MPEPWATVFPYLLAAGGILSGVLGWIAKLRWSAEYRAQVDARIAAQDEVIKSKDAQLGTVQETLKSKDATIETLKVLSYAEAERQITALKNLYQGQVSDLTQQLNDTAEKLARASADLAQGEYLKVRETLESSAKVTKDTAVSLSDIQYRRSFPSIGDRPELFFEMPGLLGKQAIQQYERLHESSQPQQDKPPSQNTECNDANQHSS